MSDMPVSKETKQVLQNLNFINSNLYIAAGKRLRSMSDNETQYAEILIGDEFPEDMYIYDLGKFLSLMSLFEEPVVRGHGNGEYCSILNSGSERSRADFYYAPPDTITSPPEGEVVIDEEDTDVVFDIDYQTLQALIKATNIIEGKYIKIANDDGKIVISAVRKDIPDTNSYTVVVGDDGQDNDYEIFINTAHLNLLPSDYGVRINSECAVFESSDDRFRYVIGISEDSTF